MAHEPELQYELPGIEPGNSLHSEDVFSATKLLASVDSLPMPAAMPPHAAGRIAVVITVIVVVVGVVPVSIERIAEAKTERAKRQARTQAAAAETAVTEPTTKVRPASAEVRPTSAEVHSTATPASAHVHSTATGSSQCGRHDRGQAQRARNCQCRKDILVFHDHAPSAATRVRIVIQETR